MLLFFVSKWLWDNYFEGLAIRTEVSAAVLQRNTLNGSTANRAGHAFPVSDVEIKMGCAQLTAGADISVRAGSFPGDS